MIRGPFKSIKMPKEGIKLVILGDEESNKEELKKRLATTEWAPGKPVDLKQDHVARIVFPTLVLSPATFFMWIDVWGAPEQPEVSSLRRMNLEGCDIAFVCFDMLSSKSFRSLKTSWIPEVREWAPSAQIWIIGMNADRLSDDERKEGQDSKDGDVVSVQEGKDLASTSLAAGFVTVTSEMSVDELGDLLTQVVTSFFDSGRETTQRKSIRIGRQCIIS